MQIAPNRVVTVTYTLTLNNGSIADQANTDHPFVFIHGIGQTLESFDSNLQGLAAGDNFQFTLQANQAYGEPTADWVIEIPRDIFRGEDVPADILQIGATLPMQDQNGNPMDGKVLSFNDDKVTMDFNHPLAGEVLHFSGTVTAVREATEEELDHGHVHGPGGHHH
ncbi:MAG: peptidylprolyl isomerase [Bacteroidetes bacterium]|nr:peptidylprolyl isomerase [Bacteroidota bacterium]